MSESRKISITEALCELKLYDSKITKAVTIKGGKPTPLGVGWIAWF